MNAAHARSSDGFTLAEMLVALVLLSMIAVMMGRQMVQFRPMRDIVQSHRLAASADVVADTVAEDLRKATGLPALSANITGALAGDDRSVAFSAAVPTGFNLTGLRDVRYFLKTDPAGKVHLIRELKLRAPAIRGDETTRTDDLFADIRSFRLGYLTSPVSGIPVWRDRWQKETTMPAAISIELTLGFASRPVTAHRTVRISATGDASAGSPAGVKAFDGQDGVSVPP